MLTVSRPGSMAGGKKRSFILLYCLAQQLTAWPRLAPARGGGEATAVRTTATTVELEIRNALAALVHFRGETELDAATLASSPLASFSDGLRLAHQPPSRGFHDERLERGERCS